MAKFATALCILFVAVGAQGLNIFSGLSSIANDVASKVEAGLQKVDTASQTVESDVQSAIASAENKTASADTTVQGWISELAEEFEKAKENFEALATKVEAIRTCVTSNINVTEINAEIAANTSSCSSEALTKLKTQYETTLTAVETFTTAEATFALAYEACAANLTTVLVCRAKLYVSASANSTASAYTALVSDTEALYEDAASFETTLAACGSSTTVDEIESEWKTDSAKIKTCIESVISSSSS